MWRLLSRWFNWRWSRILSFVLILITTYHAGAIYFGMSWKLYFLGAIVFAWFLLMFVIARMFDALSTPDQGACDRATVLGVGRAVLVGEAVVNVPALGLMLLTISLLGPVIQGWLEGGATQGLKFSTLVIVMVLAVSVGWTWWAIAMPRWRVWALERVADPRLLYGAAISAQLMWPPGGWLAFLSRTEWKTARLSRREQAALQRHIGDRTAEPIPMPRDFSSE
jgi:hypothetical protein